MTTETASLGMILRWTGPRSVGFATWVFIFSEGHALTWIESEQAFTVMYPPPNVGGFWKREQMFAEGEAQHASRVL